MDVADTVEMARRSLGIRDIEDHWVIWCLVPLCLPLTQTAVGLAPSFPVEMVSEVSLGFPKNLTVMIKQTHYVIEMGL